MVVLGNKKMTHKNTNMYLKYIFLFEFVSQIETIKDKGKKKNIGKRVGSACLIKGNLSIICHGIGNRIWPKICKYGPRDEIKITRKIANNIFAVAVFQNSLIYIKSRNNIGIPTYVPSSERFPVNLVEIKEKRLPPSQVICVGIIKLSKSDE